MAIKAIPVMSVAVGTLFAYSGIKGAGLTATLVEIIQGKKPSGENLYPISGTVDASTTGTAGVAGDASNSAFANACAAYAGKVPYIWGGSSTKGWDCSGMVNYVRSKQLGLAIPGVKAGGTYSGHGPTTLQYEIWTGATTVPRNEAQAGDLACWPSHIGVCLSQNTMVSAVDEAQGTAITSIQGPAGEPLTIRRPI